MKKRLTKSTIKARNRSWRESFTLKRIIGLTVVIFTLVGCIVSGVLALNQIYNQKSKDTWGLVFLEMERLSNKLGTQLKETYSPDKKIENYMRNQSTIYRISNQVKKDSQSGLSKKQIKLTYQTGPVLELKSFSEIGINSSYLKANSNNVLVTQLRGRPYVFNKKGNRLMVTPISLEAFMALPSLLGADSRIYVANRSGNLIYSSLQGEASWVNRGLVQKYIESPLWQGQFQYVEKDGEETVHGFFQEVPNTNLVVFAEVPSSVVFNAIIGPAISFFWITLAIIAGILLFLWFPLKMINKPIKELQSIAHQVGRGNFSMNIERSFGEFDKLIYAFSDMAKRLDKRDRKISKLAKEETIKARMETELKLASSLQQNFLPKAELPNESHMLTGSFYKSASEVAGDWYGFHYDPYTENSVVVVVDVSGHGVASCMLTAMIAGFFVEVTKKVDYDSVAGFLEKTNRAIYSLGGGSWHATAVVCLYQRKQSKMTFLNSGHQFPFVIIPGRGLLKTRDFYSASAPLGLDKKNKFTQKEIDFPFGSKVLLFTDGLIESSNSNKRPYGRKRVVKVFSKNYERPIAQVIRTLEGDWVNYLDGEVPEDDTCVVGLEAA